MASRPKSFRPASLSLVLVRASSDLDTLEQRPVKAVTSRARLRHFDGLRSGRIEIFRCGGLYDIGCPLLGPL